jgi:hypothetical protein
MFRGRLGAKQLENTHATTKFEGSGSALKPKANENDNTLLNFKDLQPKANENANAVARFQGSRGVWGPKTFENANTINTFQCVEAMLA